MAEQGSTKKIKGTFTSTREDMFFFSFSSLKLCLSFYCCSVIKALNFESVPSNSLYVVE